MSLSKFFDWNTVQISDSEEASLLNEAMAEEPNIQHLFPYSDESFFLSNALFEYTIDPNGGFLCPSDIHSPFDPFDPFTSLPHHQIFPTHEEYYDPLPKRQKFFCDEQQELSPPEGFVNGYSFQPEETQQQQQQLFSMDNQCEEKGNKERTISPQSVAARERRRKITNKTQELGKLVPGGTKMNTAEMLHAAAKYVKYLQVQVEMLELMNSLEHEDKAAPPSEILHGLVVSPFVQEKLYAGEKCFLPKETVTTLTDLEVVRSKPTMVEELKQLIGTDIEKEKQE
ncbi:transcription factor bHLH52-like [Vigna unguiculata]|uniref:transcription factor bHLH52-like n=1 Tax=Vigna unguiculata TaxID=3917 RepID=UPI001015DC56|nr:transcription factor bHLH52-like [Vigna unguiculata]